jgi:trigger factor
MSLKVEKKENNMALITIEVAAEELAKAIEKAYNKNKGQISVPGFRKGKVPKAMIEKMYGKAVFYEDAANIIIPEAYEREMADADVDVVSQPSIDIVQIEEGKPFIFTAEVALKPEVTLGKYKGVEVDAVPVKVTAKEVNAEIEKEREKSARIVEVEDRAVKDGDEIKLDFEGFVDGVAFEGGKGEDYDLTIGSGSFIPGFEDQLVGAEIGKDLDVTVTFPEEYQAEDLQGKEAVFKCKVNAIKEKQLPEVDDEFASEVSEFDTLKAYKADVKKTLKAQKEKEATAAKEDAVIEAIIEDAKMDIPDAMIETQQRQMVDEFAGRMQQQGLTLEQYFQFTGLDQEKMMEQVKPQATKRIQSSLVLEAIVDAEGIAPTDEEYEAELANMASMYQMEVEKIKEILGENEVKQLKRDLSISKAATFVLEESVEKEVEKKAPAKKAAAKKPAAKKTTAKKTTKKAEKTEE